MEIKYTMQTFMKMQNKTAAHKWFILSLWLSGLFVACTVIYAMGILNMPTLSVERWLLNRPIGGVDCLFFEWRHVGEVPVSLFLVSALGVICWRAGYNWKIIPVLFLLLFCSMGIEYIGKKTFTLYLPDKLLSGMTGLTCPQMKNTPTSVHVATMLGLWWKIPASIEGQVSWTHNVAKMPIVLVSPALSERLTSYPGGHAARWCFLGMIASWLCWKHIGHRVGRMLLTIFFLLIAFFGGFMQFYVGVHTLTDTIAGYLLGAAAASCAIGFLIIFDKNQALPNQTLSNLDGDIEAIAKSNVP
jgi:membrane-associated phospholipid phosphatase